jgi:predicted transcriptional regulator
MIVETDLYYQIRSRYNDGESIRLIARKLGISRQTVKKYCRGDTHPDERKLYHHDSEVVTQEVIDFARACLEEDKKENLSKQGHTAKRIYDRLVFEKGFRGAESTIRNLVKALRAEMYVPP